MSAPITIIFIIISIIIVSFVFMIKKYPLNEKRLDKQNLFWFSVTLPIILFFTFGLFVWTGYNIRLDEKGFSTFLEISKLPLAILALSPVFGVIISNIHRTIQTDEQIKKTSFKNNMDAFYAHNKYILEGLMDINIINCYSVENKHEKYVSYFKKITGDIECFNKYRVNENVIIKSPKRLFSKMYKKNNELRDSFEPKLNLDFAEKMNSSIEKVTKALTSFDCCFSVEKGYVEIKLDEKNFNYYEGFNALKSGIEELKSIFNIEDFLPLDYFDEFLSSEEYHIIFNKKNDNGDDKENHSMIEEQYDILLESFIIFCEFTVNHLKSLSKVINEVSELISNDPIYDVDGDIELPNIILDNSHDWSFSKLHDLPFYFRNGIGIDSV